MGNLVKIPRYNEDYLVVYQSKRTPEYAPHFFVYSIMNREIVRRFLPLSHDFNLCWDDFVVSTK